MSEALEAWRRSERFKAMQLENLRAINNGPKCGARKRSDGQPCQRPGVGAGGRCRLHGGATPKGKGKWHKPIIPDAASPNERHQRKIARLGEREEAKQKRVAAMSPDELRKYERWKRQHDPDRAAKRQQQLKGTELEKKTGSRAELVEEIRTNGAWAAYLASLDIVKDPDASRRERVQAASNILRAGGYFAVITEGGGGKDPSEMSLDELMQRHQELERQREAISAEEVRKPAGNLFD